MPVKGSQPCHIVVLVRSIAAGGRGEESTLSRGEGSWIHLGPRQLKAGKGKITENSSLPRFRLCMYLLKTEARLDRSTENFLPTPPYPTVRSTSTE